LGKTGEKNELFGISKKKKNNGGKESECRCSTPVAMLLVQKNADRDRQKHARKKTGQRKKKE